MNGKALFGILLLAATGLLAAEYLGFTHFLDDKGGQSEAQNARNSFNQMVHALAKNDVAKVTSLVSPTFTDKKVDRKKFLKIVTQKRKKYTATGITVQTRDNFATISYTRIEARSADPFTSVIKDEMWMRDSADPKTWKLHKLAASDKWFRKMKGPKGKKKKATQAAPDLLGEARAAVGPRVMDEGGRYSPKDKRDPFRSLIASDASEDDMDMDHCDAGRPRQFLESFDLMSLKLSGVIERAGGAVALVETPDGKGHTVRRSMYLGRNCGQVESITRDTINIREKIQKPGPKKTGEYIETTTELKLRPEEG